MDPGGRSSGLTSPWRCRASPLRSQRSTRHADTLMRSTIWQSNWTRSTRAVPAKRSSKATIPRNSPKTKMAREPRDYVVLTYMHQTEVLRGWSMHYPSLSYPTIAYCLNDLRGKEDIIRGTSSRPDSTWTYGQARTLISSGSTSSAPGERISSNTLTMLARRYQPRPPHRSVPRYRATQSDERTTAIGAGQAC